jgi:hypothetical protein
MCAFEWFKRFREGCDSFEDKSSHGQLSTAQNLETVAEGCELVARVSRVTLKLMEDQLKMIYRTFPDDVGNREIFAKISLHILMHEQQEQSHRVGNFIVVWWRSPAHLINLTSHWLPLFYSLK